MRGWIQKGLELIFSFLVIYNTLTFEGIWHLTVYYNCLLSINLFRFFFLTNQTTDNHNHQIQSITRYNNQIDISQLQSKVTVSSMKSWWLLSDKIDVSDKSMLVTFCVTDFYIGDIFWMFMPDTNERQGMLMTKRSKPLPTSQSCLQHPSSTSM